MNPACPRCGADAPYVLAQKGKFAGLRFRCHACGRDYTETSNSPWRATKLTADQRQEVEAMLLAGVNAFQVHQRTGVSYRTAWKAQKRIRNAFAQS